MEGSTDGVPQTSAQPENIVESLSEDLNELRILDVDNLLTNIKDIYQCIREQSADPTTISGKFVDIPLLDPKSIEQANESRKQAEQLWKIGRFSEALLHITECIAHAENDSEELASAYFDRSYVLFKLEKYNCCLKDVHRAIEIENCPEKLKRKLRERKKQCMIEQKNITTVEEEDLHLEWRKSCNLKPTDTPLPNTSPKLKIDFDEKQERHLIATEDIQPGEILSIDDFYFTVLSNPRCFTNCTFCLLECDTLIPCPNCARELYCSEECRSRAFDLFHQSECKFMKLYTHRIGSYTLVMAIRMFLLGTEQGKQLENLMEKVKPHDIFVDKYDNSSRFDDYRSTLQIRRIDHIQNNTICQAVSIIVVLLRSSFFGDFDTLPDELNSLQTYAALLLINHITTLEMVDPAVEKLCLCTEGTPEVKRFECQKVGFGLCVLQDSLIKHSCYANTSSFIQNRQQIVFATRKIQSGEKLSTIRSAMYKVPYRPEEDQAASETSCVCGIDACSENCPKLESLIDAEITFSPAFEDPSYATKMKALAVKTLVKIKRAKKQFKVLSNQENLELIIEHCNFLSEILTIPSYDIVLLEQLVLVFMKVLYCDHQRPYRHLSLQNYFHDILGLVGSRIYENFM